MLSSVEALCVGATQHVIARYEAISDRLALPYLTQKQYE